MNIHRLKLLVRKIVLKYFSRFVGPYYYNTILQMQGIEVGAHTIFYSPNTMNIDVERPWMLKIGDYCKITAGCTILTHDYSRSVLRRVYGEIIGEGGETVISDNVFIGMNSIILMGTKIGKNVIVGAGSVVSGVIPDNVVIAGNPARVIRTLDEHYEIRKRKSIGEAVVYYNTYKSRFNKYPSESARTPFISMYTDRETFDYEKDTRLNCNGDNIAEVKHDFRNTKPIFKSYDDFINFIESENS